MGSRTTIARTRARSERRPNIARARLSVASPPRKASPVSRHSRLLAPGNVRSASRTSSCSTADAQRAGLCSALSSALSTSLEVAACRQFGVCPPSARNRAASQPGTSNSASTRPARRLASSSSFSSAYVSAVSTCAAGASLVSRHSGASSASFWEYRFHPSDVFLINSIRRARARSASSPRRSSSARRRSSSARRRASARRCSSASAYVSASSIRAAGALCVSRQSGASAASFSEYSFQPSVVSLINSIRRARARSASSPRRSSSARRRSSSARRRASARRCSSASAYVSASSIRAAGALCVSRQSGASAASFSEYSFQPSVVSLINSIRRARARSASSPRRSSSARRRSSSARRRASARRCSSASAYVSASSIRAAGALCVSRQSGASAASFSEYSFQPSVVSLINSIRRARARSASSPRRSSSARRRSSSARRRASARRCSSASAYVNAASRSAIFGAVRSCHFGSSSLSLRRKSSLPSSVDSTASLRVLRSPSLFSATACHA